MPAPDRCAHRCGRAPLTASLRLSLKKNEEWAWPGRLIALSRFPDSRDVCLCSPGPRSLAWDNQGELDPQDQFDLLQSSMVSKTDCMQTELIAAVERISLDQLSVTSAVTGLLRRVSAKGRDQVHQEVLTF